VSVIHTKNKHCTLINIKLGRDTSGARKRSYDWRDKAVTNLRSIILPILTFLLAFSLLAGCSSSNQQSTSSIFDSSTGKHIEGWSSPEIHGVTVKAQVDGFSACQECHGADFSGGISAVSCFSCHGVNAPHARAPWMSAARTHTTTNPGNAAVCAQCHTNGANSSLIHSPAVPPGTAPGCFNNTLCHAAVGHPAGWALPDQHGTWAKSQPTYTAGFATCEICHASDFTGGVAQTSCFTCHGVNAPHPPKPWRDSTYTHATTDPGNATVCAQCHINGANSSVQPSSPAPAGTAPACFNNTLCHAGHDTGWASPDQHGVNAEQNFSACKSCHGPDYKGGTTTISCYKCHNGPGLNHPAPAWVIYDHKTAAITDNMICQNCHGTNYLGGGSHVACNSCHMENQTKVHQLGWYPNVRYNHGAYVLANGVTACSNIYCHGSDLSGVSQSGYACNGCHVWPISDCTTCHGTPPSGTLYPNVAGKHTAHTTLSTSIACGTCHQGAGAGTTNHMNGKVDVILDPTYYAKSGIATYNAATNTCSNISCHGGQITPDWSTGTIDVNTQCTSCHSYGTAQYNSFFSGRHDYHVNILHIDCVFCHDTNKLSVNHLTTLNTTIMEGPAAATLLDNVYYDGRACTPDCHDANWGGEW
jgi:predicted CxxxxCH...CXXCH cytochrome family protein